VRQQTGTKIGITPQKENVMKNVEIRYAYLSPMGKISLLYISIYYYFVYLEVILL
jgi:hypothetical protein